MLTYQEFHKIYHESGEVAARLVYDDVHMPDRFWIFENNSELAHWLLNAELREVDWQRLITQNRYRAGVYLRYCDLSKRGFDFICHVLHHETRYHDLLDFTKVPQSMWERFIIACAREDFDVFMPYVNRDELQLSASALWKLEQYDMEREARGRSSDDW